MEQFAEAEKILSNKGYEVINPTKISNCVNYFDYADFVITSMMLLKKCEAIYFLANWGNSVGSKIEKEVAKKLGLKIMHEKYFGRTVVHRTKINKNQIKIEEIRNNG
jgi:hypothetical protein